MKTNFKKESYQLGINLTGDQEKHFYDYLHLLQEWNQKINLTAITEEDEIIQKHFIDSLSIESFIPKGISLIDIGTGAGFPGIPIRIVREDIKITLLDSLKKRIQFLETVIEALELKEINCIHGRAEDLAKQREYRETYDLAVARAVANMATLTEICMPFIKLGGIFLCMKGSSVEEIEPAKKSIHLMGGEIEEIKHFYLPNSKIERNIILIRKIKETPKQYPRKAGIPSKNPIL